MDLQQIEDQVPDLIDAYDTVDEENLHSSPIIGRGVQPS